MKVSVITVAYNAAETIGRTIDSVLNQEYTAIEHIIVDGNSPDGTADVVAKRAPGARLVVEDDRGLYDAMNKGIGMATGDVVAILNADDYYCHSGVLSRVAAVFDCGDPDAVFGDIGFFRPETPGRIFRRYQSRAFKPSKVKFGLMPAHPGMFLRRRVYERFGKYDISYRIAADFEFVARMFARGGVSYAHLDEVLVLMQAGGTSTRSLRNSLTIYRECLRACRANGISSSHFHMLAKYPIKLPQYFGKHLLPLSGKGNQQKDGPVENTG